MSSISRQHAGSALVAASVIVAAMCEGLFEPLGYSAAALIVWGVIAICLTGGVFGLARIGRLTRLAGLLFAGLAVLTLASTLWASDQGEAFDQGVRAAFYLGLFILAACTADRRSRRIWIAGLAIGLTAVALVALFAYFQPGTLNSGRSDIPNAAGRLSYPIGYWNGAASLFAMTAALLAHWAVRGRTVPTRATATALIPAIGLAVWLTDSRGGLAALALGWIALLAFSPDRLRLLKAMVLGAVGGVVLVAIVEQMNPLTSGALDPARRADGDWMTLLVVFVSLLTGAFALLTDDWEPQLQFSRRAKLAAVAVVLIGAVLTVIAAGPSKRIHEFTAVPAANAQSHDVTLGSNGRWQFWRSAVHAFESSPAHGVGAGGWEAYWGAHSTFPRFVRNPHSLPLQTAAELGVPGIACLLGLIGVIVLAAWRRLRLPKRGDAPVLAAVLVAVVVGTAMDWAWQIPGVFIPAILCAGLLVASAPPLITGRRTWEGVAVLSFAAAAMVASALVLGGDIELRRSRAAADDGRLTEAISRARDANSFEPWASEPYLQLTLARESQKRFPLALADLREAIKRDSADWRLSFIEARLLGLNGEPSAARKALVRARSQSPFNSGPG
jgi:hypothetical protein